MKRILLVPALLVSLGGLPAKATQFWYDVITNYPGGCITTNTADWFPHLPGSLTATDALIVTNTYTSGAAVNGKHLRINGLNSEYIMRLFDSATTNVLYSGVVYASFIANANFVPAAGAGTYFASFDNADTNNPPQVYTNGFDFRGRVSEIGATNIYPNTTRVGSCFQWGIANAAGDPAQGGLPSILFVPIDAVKNIDYQIVVKYDIDNAQATLWVNPASESDTGNMAGPTTDFGTVVNGLAGLLFRQRTGGGTVDIRDVVVGTTFADVMTNVASASPVLIANTFNTVTNYAGNPGLLEVFATSLGGGPLSYQWYQVSGGVTNSVGGNSQTYLVPSLSGTDTGSYFCAVTNSGGQGALSPSSAKFYISVNTTPTAPSFTSKPAASTNGTVGGSLSLAAPATGTGPLTYAWTFNGNPLTDGQPMTGNPGDASVVSGSQTPNLTIGFMSTNETGTLTVTVTGGVAPAASTSVALTVNPARAVSIGYIRSLEDTNTWQVTDTGSIFVVSNAVVTMFTNVTSGTTASYYVQDASGCGLDLFVTGDASFRPQMGDLVSFGGTLSMYNNAIETDIISGAPYQFYAITGHTNVLPAPVVFSLGFTNIPALMETNFEGRLCMLTNVYFNYSAATYPNGYPTTTGNKNLYVTNNSPGSVPLNVFLPGGTDTDLNNQTVQRFAYTITGVMAQFKSGAYANSGYELYVTRFGDIVTAPPPQVTDLKATVAGSDVVLTWTAVPYTIDTRGAYSYTVLASPDVAGPYLPLASLAFSTSAASFTHTNALSGTQMFYQISSP
jgi:hypothetical protein